MPSTRETPSPLTILTFIKVAALPFCKNAARCDNRRRITVPGGNKI